MDKNSFRTYAEENGGRVSLLFLLFLLALYEFYSMGFGIFAVICLSPILIVVTLALFQYPMVAFWSLVVINYLIQAKWLSLPLPTSVPNELLQLLLLALAIINPKDNRFDRSLNLMFLAVTTWCGFCTLEVLNDTCDIGIDVGAWYTVARMIGYQLMYIFLVFTLYVDKPKVLIRYLYVWGGLALFAVFWVWKQKNIGFTDSENVFLQGRGHSTHVLQGGTLIRYFSIYSDAANFGIGIASTAVAFIIFGITSKVRKWKLFFLVAGIGCAWAMFISGTRTAIACFMFGMVMYIFLSKSIKIAIPFTVILTLFIFMLAFTTIGNSNQSIRRMRSAFDKNDASAGQRSVNQEAMKKYMAEAPWGIGMGVGYGNAPANNKYSFMATVPPDSEFVFIWIHTGIIGITVFLGCMALMLFGGCRIVFFVLESPSLRGIGAGMCCAFGSQLVGGYGNQVLLQFPNCLAFFGGLAIVYVLPYLETEWVTFEAEQLAIEAEKKRLKLEKKNAQRV